MLYAYGKVCRVDGVSFPHALLHVVHYKPTYLTGEVLHCLQARTCSMHPVSASVRYVLYVCRARSTTSTFPIPIRNVLTTIYNKKK